MGASAALPMFWQFPPAFLSTIPAAGIALISSFGSIASFFAPYLIGWMRDTTQSASLALYVLALLIALGGFRCCTQAAIVNPRKRSMSCLTNNSFSKPPPASTTPSVHASRSVSFPWIIQPSPSKTRTPFNALGWRRKSRTAENWSGTKSA
jgi:hypothetical protein